MIWKAGIVKIIIRTETFQFILPAPSLYRFSIIHIFIRFGPIWNNTPKASGFWIFMVRGQNPNTKSGEFIPVEIKTEGRRKETDC